LDSLDTSPQRAGLVISTSDYHHSYAGAVKRSKGKALSRSSSKFSVYHAEHLASKHSFFEEDTDACHDPFRVPKQDRRESKDLLHPSRGTGHGMKSSLRVEALKRQNSKRLSAHSKRSRASMSHLSMGSRHSKTLSHASTTSLLRGSPAPIVVSLRHKRGVSFNHIRHGGSPTVKGHSKSPMGVPRCDSQVLPTSSGSSEFMMLSSPPPLPGNVHEDNKASVIHTHAANQRTRTLKAIDIEARKVSTDLERVCNEAFFRESTSEKSYRSSVSEVAQLGGETPPSSISNGSSNPKALKPGKFDPTRLKKPLPPTPGEKTTLHSVETPGTYTNRELQAMRERLAHRYAQDGISNKHFYNDILRQLDSLMPQDSTRDTHKLLSYQVGTSFLSSEDFLQAIPEEGRGQSSDEFLPGSAETTIRQNIATTNFFAHPKRVSAKKLDHFGTIRVVEPSSPQSPTPRAPLNIRKSSGVSNPSSLENSSRTSDSARVVSGSPLQIDGVCVCSNDTESLITSIALYPDSQQTSQTKSAVKGAWWRRTSQLKDSLRKPATIAASATSDWADLDDRTVRRDQRRGESMMENSSIDGASNSTSLPQTPPRAKRDSRLRRGSRLDELSSSEIPLGEGVKRSFFKGFFQKKHKPVYHIERGLYFHVKFLTRD
jgi:serine/threonine-protein kinase HSL1, negative regulator of Swe1 kinase